MLETLFNLLANPQAELNALSKSQAVIKFTPKGKILWANKNFLSAMGYKLSEIRGKHHSIFVDPEESKSLEYENFWQGLASGEFKSEQFKRFDKAGKEIWIQASYNPIKGLFGRTAKVVKFATDITAEVMKATDHAGQIEAINKSNAVIEFKPDGTIIHANENFLVTTGYSLNQIVGNHHSMFVCPEYRLSSEYQEFWKDLSAGKYQAGEYKRFGRGGKEVWLQASYNPIFDKAGKIIKVVKYATDVTTRVNTQTNVADYVCNSGAASEQLAQYITNVVSATEEMASSINEISSNTSNAATETDKAVEVINKSDEMINSLKQKSNEIGNILEVVSEIAGQTNLLALNATIEAARAGEAGKGFAVVANEVKELAGKTTEATCEINRNIVSIQQEVDQVLDSITQATQSIESLSQLTTSIASAMEEQSSVTNEISDSMKLANTQVGDVTQNISDISEAVAKL